MQQIIMSPKVFTRAINLLKDLDVFCKTYSKTAYNRSVLSKNIQELITLDRKQQIQLNEEKVQECVATGLFESLQLDSDVGMLTINGKRHSILGKQYDSLVVALFNNFSDYGSDLTLKIPKDVFIMDDDIWNMYTEIREQCKEECPIDFLTQEFVSEAKQSRVDNLIQVVEDVTIKCIYVVYKNTFWNKQFVISREKSEDLVGNIVYSIGTHRYTPNPAADDKLHQISSIDPNIDNIFLTEQEAIEFTKKNEFDSNVDLVRSEKLADYWEEFMYGNKPAHVYYIDPISPYNEVKRGTLLRTEPTIRYRKDGLCAVVRRDAPDFGKLYIDALHIFKTSEEATKFLNQGSVKLI